VPNLKGEHEHTTKATLVEKWRIFQMTIDPAVLEPMQLQTIFYYCVEDSGPRRRQTWQIRGKNDLNAAFL